MLRLVSFKGWIYKKVSKTPIVLKSKAERGQNLMPGYRSHWAVLRQGRLQLYSDASTTKEEEEKYNLLETTKFEALGKLKFCFTLPMGLTTTINNDEEDLIFKFDDHVQRNNWYYLIIGLKKANEKLEEVVARQPEPLQSLQRKNHDHEPPRRRRDTLAADRGAVDPPGRVHDEVQPLPGRGQKGVHPIVAHQR